MALKIILYNYIMENSTEHTGASFARHIEACLELGTPVNIPRLGEYAITLIPEQAGPADRVYFEAIRIDPVSEQAQGDPELHHVIGSFSTTHTPLNVVIAPHATEQN